MLAGRVHRAPAPERPARAPDRARARGPRPGRARPLQQGDRGPARHHRADGAHPRVEHPGQARPRQPDAGRALGDRAPGGLARWPADGPWTALGPVDAPAIVFVHGTRLTRAQWSSQLRLLSGRYRCIAIDLPGHGARAGEPFTREAAAAAVAEAIEAESAVGARGRRGALAGRLRGHRHGRPAPGPRGRAGAGRVLRGAGGLGLAAVPLARGGARAGPEPAARRCSTAPSSALRYPARIAAPDHRGRLLVGRRRGLAPEHRRRPLPRPARLALDAGPRRERGAGPRLRPRRPRRGRPPAGAAATS